MAKNIEKYLNAEKVDISEWKKISSAALKDEFISTKIFEQTQQRKFG